MQVKDERFNLETVKILRKILVSYKQRDVEYLRFNIDIFNTNCKERNKFIL